jgi:hypothetical protein
MVVALVVMTSQLLTQPTLRVAQILLEDIQAVKADHLDQMVLLVMVAPVAQHL